MSDENTRIVEINGIRIEVDLRTAKRVDTYRVGDPVKVLKKLYGDTYYTYPGIISGFDEFKELPTITVAYMKDGALEFAGINAKSKDIEIVLADRDTLHMEKADVLRLMDRQMAEAEMKVSDLRQRREYFLARFGAYFAPAEQFAQSQTEKV